MPGGRSKTSRSYKKRSGKRNPFKIQKVSKTRRMLGEERVNFTNLRQVVDTVEKMATNLSPERKYNEDASPEAAYFMTIGALPPIDFSTTFGALVNNVNQGEGVEQRIGNKVRLTDLDWKFIVRLTDALGNDVVSYRAIILVEKSGFSTSWDQVYKRWMADSDTILDGKLATIAGIDREESSDFVTLLNKTYTIDDVQALSRVHKFHKKLDFNVEYFDTGAGDITRNVVWYGVVPSNALTAQFFVTSFMRSNYTDV